MPIGADQQPDPYLDRLAPDDREAYRVASPDVDLSSEIRLMRTVLAHLADDLPANHKSITLVLGMLVRAASLHSRQSPDRERSLLDAAEDILGEDA